MLLRGPSDRGWWFRNDAADVALEPAVILEDGVPRRAAQIVLKGMVDGAQGARVRWKLAPVDLALKSPAAIATVQMLA